MKTTPTTTNDTTTAGYLPYRRTPADALAVDPQAHPDLWSFSEARLERQREHLAPVWAMTVEQRIAAMRRGELTMTQLTRWASRYPNQVPTINSEFEFIAALTPEIAEGAE
jgi:hypothetical protein